MIYPIMHSAHPSDMKKKLFSPLFLQLKNGTPHLQKGKTKGEKGGELRKGKKRGKTRWGGDDK
jgi:hypothetical protein